MTKPVPNVSLYTIVVMALRIKHDLSVCAGPRPVMPISTSIHHLNCHLVYIPLMIPELVKSVELPSAAPNTT
jgi:hypothetical protein